MLWEQTLIQPQGFSVEAKTNVSSFRMFSFFLNFIYSLTLIKINWFHVEWLRKIMFFRKWIGSVCWALSLIFVTFQSQEFKVHSSPLVLLSESLRAGWAVFEYDQKYCSSYRQILVPLPLMICECVCVRKWVCVCLHLCIFPALFVCVFMIRSLSLCLCAFTCV